MIKKIIVILRPLKYLIKLFFYSPRYLYKKIYLDLKKDSNSKKLKKEFYIVWCAGLPKSGTTLIEDILNNFPLVQANNSFFRIYDDSNLDHIHGISEEMFNRFPKNKLTFLKTHSHYNENYINIAHKHNAKIIVSMRDIRDAMISRYYHVINDPKHWQHNMIKDLKFKEGFIKSIREGSFIFFKTSKCEKPIDYYYGWLNNWQNCIKKKK